MDKELEMLLEQIEIDAHEDETIMNYVRLIHVSMNFKLTNLHPIYDPTVLLGRLVQHVQGRYDYSSDFGEYPFVGAASWMKEATDYLQQQGMQS